METVFTQASSILLSPHVEQIAKQVAAKHGWDWRENEARLGIAMVSRLERWLIINLDGERISLTRYFLEADGTLTPDVDIVFELHDVGWEPIELLYSNEVFD